VDVASAHLDACVGPQGPELRVANTAAGIAELASFCRAHQAELVVMEATGGYERLAFGLLWADGLACAVVNPRAVRRFAEAMGRLEKTDRIDAGVIAHYGAVKQVAPCTPADAKQRRLHALAGRIRQLTQIKVAQTAQRAKAEIPEVLAGFTELLAMIERQIADLAAELRSVIDADPLWAALDRAFREIKGVSDRTVATVLAEFPEIGTLSNKAASKLAGLAPLAQDSGKRAGKRRVRGGRASVRSILFVVAGVVARHDPDFAETHRRLTAQGKPKMVVRIALARKLLVRLNARARERDSISPSISPGLSQLAEDVVGDLVGPADPLAFQADGEIPPRVA
jgi:transposase